MSNRQKYITIFTATFYISAFTFGGGYVIIPLLKNKFCDELGWIEEDEMLNLVSIAQSSPGAVAVNAAILIGYKSAGIVGMLVSILGTILPPMLIISTISMFYEAFRANEIVAAVLKGMQAGIAAIILDVALNLGENVMKEKNKMTICLMIMAFIATYFFSINLLYLILGCALAGVIQTTVKAKRLKEEECE